jgi:carnosine N-methyltransferase
MIQDPVFAAMMAPDSGDGHSHSHSHTHSHDHSHSHDSSSAPSSSGTPTTPSTRRASQQETDLAQEKVRSTLRSFVRDWSSEGAVERQACYDPCLEALERHWQGTWQGSGRKKGDVSVLVPGCGLGRLAMEIAVKGEFRRCSWPSGLTSTWRARGQHNESGGLTKTGYASQGNEFSTYMLLASHFVLNQ